VLAYAGDDPRNIVPGTNGLDAKKPVEHILYFTIDQFVNQDAGVIFTVLDS
jgi:hypothetical protein